jgi:hypothetical protein
MLLVTVFAGYFALTRCQAQTSLKPQEKFVRDQVVAGKCVAFSTTAKNAQPDLCRNKVVWPKANDSTLTSEFIEQLLMGKLQGAKSIRFVAIDGIGEDNRRTRLKPRSNF